jgi:hypothetical protein
MQDGNGRMISETAPYTYQVFWSEEDQEFVGVCVQFPSLSWLAATEEEALCGIQTTVADVVAEIHASSKPVE